MSEKKGNGFGVAGFVLGLLGVLMFGWGFVLSILGLIFSIIQLRRHKTGLAIAGLILSIIGLVMFVLVVGVTIIWAAIIPMVNSELDSATDCLDAMQQLTILNRGNTCYDSSSSIVNVEVAHGSREVGVTGIKVLVSSDSCSSESNIYSEVPGMDSHLVLSVPVDCSSASAVSIVPIIGEMQCDALSRVQLREC